MTDATVVVPAVSRRALREADLVLRRCEELATHTSLPGSIERLHLTPQHAGAASLVEAWMREAGLRTWTDAAGNQLGRLEGRSAGLPALLLGSHLDSAPDGGPHDGVLGVLAAIAVAGRYARSAEPLPFALEVAAFADAQGARFGTPMSGSRASAGTWDYRWWDREDADGVTLYEAFDHFGLHPARIEEAARRPEELVGYLEVQLAQGGQLDRDRPLAVVTALAGARRFAITVTGRAAHAGATPYERRRDALVAASELVLAVERTGRELGVLATVGRLQAFPGGADLVPGSVELTLDVRALRDVDRDAACEALRDVARDLERRRGVMVETSETDRTDAARSDEALVAAVTAGIRAVGDPAPPETGTGAGLDALSLASVTGVALLLVRAAEGVGHHPGESVDRLDLAAALDALDTAVRSYARTRSAVPYAGAF